jgi:hypothetical protein
MGLNWGSLQACLDGLLLCNLRPIFLSSYDYPVQRWNGFITERETKVVHHRFQKQKSDGSTRVNLRFFVIVVVPKEV